MDQHQDPQLASADRADDEKTIQADPPEQESSETKDTEAAKGSSASFHEDEDFPDGGLKAWSVAIGVSVIW